MENKLVDAKWVVWKDQKMWVGDYELFVMIIRQWIESGMTKELALDLCFEMNL